MGHRHCADGSSIADGIDSQTDNKGYTGHEMLGQLDLVHMNGRIYDPLVARMMSADPFIQDPEHSQSYNRYTYVWNNPTNLTDPTGFNAAKDCDISCQDDRRRTDQCAAMAGNCAQAGKTDYEAQPSKSADNSGKRAPSATNGGVTTLTARDIELSWAVGVGNKLANVGGGFANLLIAMGPGDAELIGSVRPFEGKDHFSEARAGEATGALLEVSAARGFGRGLSDVLAADRFIRVPQSLQDQMALNAAKNGSGEMIIPKLSDPKFKGMEKWEYKVKSEQGKDSVVHYVRDPKTGQLMDFKFKKSSTDTPSGKWEKTPDPKSTGSGTKPSWWPF